MANRDRRAKRIYDHFSEVSASYNDIRITDLEPILFVKEKLTDRRSIRAADIGCGAGRYSLLLLQHLPGLDLICNDVNKSMVTETARYLEAHGAKNFLAVQADISDLQLKNDSMDCILAFNAIHHFDPVIFLNKVAKALRKNGYVFIYTRLKEQNARNIWGRFFPEFTDKEERLYDLTEVESWGNQQNSVELTSIEFFKFKRTAALQQLIQQAENKHYSTFSFYSAGTYERALAGFQANIKRHFTDLNRIEWFDENVMIVLRKV